MDRIVNYLNIILFLTLTCFVISGCGKDAGGPKDIVFNFEINDGIHDPDVKIIKVDQGDTVTLRVQTDTQGALHLHGYNIVEDVEPGTTGIMKFVADATGRFSIKFHFFEEKKESHEKTDVSKHTESGIHESKEEGVHTEEQTEITVTTLEVHPK